MFDGLKKKFSNFIHSVAKKEEEKTIEPTAKSSEIQEENLNNKAEVKNLNTLEEPKNKNEQQAQPAKQNMQQHNIIKTEKIEKATEEKVIDNTQKQNTNITTENNPNKPVTEL